MNSRRLQRGFEALGTTYRTATGTRVRLPKFYKKLHTENLKFEGLFIIRDFQTASQKLRRRLAVMSELGLNLPYNPDAVTLLSDAVTIIQTASQLISDAVSTFCE